MFLLGLDVVTAMVAIAAVVALFVSGWQLAVATHQAISKAKLLAQDHAGAIAWAREADPDHGEYGEPEILFQAGEIPDME